ncbi:MAG: hypothetical protein K6E10_01495 [Eubacterium sp.]|nr:hypothetical protein [Eubacterium sp.]
MRHAITRIIIGIILTVVGLYGLVSGKGTNMGLTILLGLIFCVSGFMILRKKNKGL